MRIENAQIKDIEMKLAFGQDYESAPERVKRAVDKLIRLVSDHGYIPNSLKAHRRRPGGDIWIGYISRTNQHWRVLFLFERGVLVLERLVDHDEMDRMFNARYY